MGPDRLFPEDGVFEAGSRDAWVTIERHLLLNWESQGLCWQQVAFTHVTNCCVYYRAVVNHIQHQLPQLNSEKNFLYCLVWFCSSLALGPLLYKETPFGQLQGILYHTHIIIYVSSERNCELRICPLLPASYKPFKTRDWKTIKKEIKFGKCLKCKELRPSSWLSLKF